jgi:RNA polymerase sigma-70 factor, ECF subfamily
MGLASKDIEAIYRRTRGALYARCKALLGDEAEAKDLLHEVYLTLLEHPEACLSAEDPIRYLFAIATKRALSRMRARYRRHEAWENAVSTLLASTAPSGDPRVRTEAKDALAKILAETDEPTALMVLYHFVDGLSQGEVASLLGVSRVTVNQKLSAFRRTALSALSEN